ncbi:hypothetical protein T492DRAFT_219272 [Pavlovales sp. CCMP2436]|nr:hypothetical protein T492DRAFT_219272 [Pavlovales sp. CCMP2436]
MFSDSQMSALAHWCCPEVVDKGRIWPTGVFTVRSWMTDSAKSARTQAETQKARKSQMNEASEEQQAAFCKLNERSRISQVCASRRSARTPPFAPHPNLIVSVAPHLYFLAGTEGGSRGAGGARQAPAVGGEGVGAGGGRGWAIECGRLGQARAVGNGGAGGGLGCGCGCLGRAQARVVCGGGASACRGRGSWYGWWQRAKSIEAAPVGSLTGPAAPRRAVQAAPW